jgi:hypothetical protein
MDATHQLLDPKTNALTTPLRLVPMLHEKKAPLPVCQSSSLGGWRVERLPCKRLFAGFPARGGIFCKQIRFVLKTAGFLLSPVLSSFSLRFPDYPSIKPIKKKKIESNKNKIECLFYFPFWEGNFRTRYEEPGGAN